MLETDHGDGRYLRPRIESLDGPSVVAALGPASAYGANVVVPPPCQTTCPLCANWCGASPC